MHITSPIVALTLSLFGNPVWATTTSYIPATSPSWAQDLPKDLVGLSIELSDFSAWAGPAVGKPNDFVNTALNNLKKLTGVAPPIRVGGSSEDKAFLSSSVEYVNSTYPTPTETSPYPPASVVYLSPKFYQLSGNFPAGTQFVWGINLESLNVTESVNQAMAIVDAFYGSGKQYTGKQTLSFLELGNEPDLYSVTLFGGKLPDFDVFNYTAAWTSTLAAIAKAVDPWGTGHPKFYGGSFSDAMYRFGQFAPTSVLNANESVVSKYLGMWNKHFYSTVNLGPGLNPPQGSLLGKNGVRANVSIHGAHRAQVASAGLGLVMGETNTAARHGIIGMSDAAEAVIFLVDYALQYAVNGIKQIHLHNGIGYAYSLLQPSAISIGPYASEAPKVQSAYYAAYIVGELIGPKPQTKIVELASNNNAVAAYGVYEDDHIARAIFISHQPNFPGNVTAPAVPIVLLGKLANTKIFAKKFSAPYTNSTSGLTWGGQSLDSPLNVTFNATAGRTAVANQTFLLGAGEIAMLTFEKTWY